MYLQSRHRYPERRASNEHGNDDGSGANGVGAEASSAWCAGWNARLRLGHALGIHLVARFGKNTKTVADRSVVVPAGGGHGIHLGINVGFRLRVFGEWSIVCRDSHRLGLECADSHLTDRRARTAVI